MSTFNIDPSILAKAEEYVAREDQELDFDDKSLTKQALRSVTKTTVKARNTVKAVKERTVTKSVRALQVYNELGGDRAKVIAALMSTLGMSKAGATTYFYNAKKAAK